MQLELFEVFGYEQFPGSLFFYITSSFQIFIDFQALSVDMSNAINSFYYIYDICSSDYSKSHFNALAHMLCGKQDEIAKHSDCYQKTLEKMKCAVKVVIFEQIFFR